MAHIAVVTGGSGFVATEVTKQLLEKGYTVRATVRDPEDEGKTEHLRRLGQALPGTLELLQADLLKEGSFDAAVKGAHFVFHVASPFQFPSENVEAALIEPAVTGTKNVLAACARNKATIKRIIVTSSVAAVSKSLASAPPKNGTLFTEEDWNETSTIENGEGYWVSKTRAERAAWDLARENGLDLVTILPNFIMGPIMSTRTDGISVGFLKGWLEGTASTGNITYSDVRDVARAHVLAAETPGASGRYIVSQATSASPAFISAALRARFPQFHIPAGEELADETTIDNSKATRELGVHLTPLASSFVDMAVTLIALGVAKPTPAGGAA